MGWVKNVIGDYIAGDYRCPKCNATFIYGAGETNYCGNCGQKLD